MRGKADAVQPRRQPAVKMTAAGRDRDQVQSSRQQIFRPGTGNAFVLFEDGTGLERVEASVGGAPI